MSATADQLETLLAPAHTALIVVDLQNDFCAPLGAFGRAGTDLSMMPPVISRTSHVVDSARRAGALVVWLQQTVLPHGLSLPPAALRARDRYLASERCIDGTAGPAIVEPLQPLAGEPVIKKLRSSGFVGTMLDLVLDSNGIATCVCLGVGTEGCVEATARSAAAHDYAPVIVEDCVASVRMDLHGCSLQTMGAQYRLIRSPELIRAWEGTPPPAGGLRPHVGLRGDRALAEILEPSHTALVIACGRRADGVQPGADGTRAGLALAARRMGIPVIRLVENHAAEPIAGCAEDMHEIVLHSPRADGFVGTPLRLTLRERGIQTIVLCGAPAEGLVESTARSAIHHNYDVVCVPDAIDASAPGLYEAALAIMRHRYDTALADHVIATWNVAGAVNA